jgi:hypothetical protein
MIKAARSVPAIAFFIFAAVSASGQDQREKQKNEFYFSWGYNTEWFTNSNVRIRQPALGNDYTFENIKGHDHRGWDEGLFSKALTIPQYNYRLGFLFNPAKGLAFEVNFDHTKFIFTDNRQVHVKGTVDHKNFDGNVLFSSSNGDSSSYYYLNNGANFLLLNIVKRWHVFKLRNEKIKLDLFGKFGVGPVIPHVENELFGKSNDPHFQFGGWNTGIEGTLRATFFKYVYLEYCNKIDYARYSNLKIDEGTAKQAFGTYEMILNLGLSFPVGKPK